MSYPNPDVYGAPSSWDYCPIFYVVGNGNATYKTEKPKIAVWDSSSSTDRKGTIIRGMNAGKLPRGNATIDMTVCPCGQDANVSCFGDIALFTNHRSATDNLIPDYVHHNTAPVNWFMHAISDYDGGLRNHLINRNDGKERWSPNPNFDGYSNNNLYVSPFVYWQSKSILIQIYVEYIIEYYSSGIPSTSRVSLREWKNAYSDKKICAIHLEFLGTSSSSSTNINYVHNSDAGWDSCVSVSLMDEINGVIDYATFQNDRTQQFDLLEVYTGNWYDITSTYYMLGWNRFQNAELKTMAQQSTEYGWCLWLEIPYSEFNYEQIMKMIACFGMPFTDTTTDSFNTNFLSNDIFLPIVDTKGITHGRYTHGADNANNPFINVNSVRDFNYNPYDTGFNNYLGDLQIDKIYLGDRQIDKVYLGDIAL